METAILDLSLYKAALIVLGAAAIVIPLFHRLRVSSVLGFMLVGIVVGPFGLASLVPSLPWLSAVSIREPASIEPIADLGVVLLLFMIGLELSFERLVVMRRLVFGLGSLQFILCAGLSPGPRRCWVTGRSARPLSAWPWRCLPPPWSSRCCRRRNGSTRPPDVPASPSSCFRIWRSSRCFSSSCPRTDNQAHRRGLCLCSSSGAIRRGGDHRARPLGLASAIP